MDRDITRRAFVIHVGAAATLLGGAVPSSAQTPPAPVAGKEKLIVRSPRPINLETPFRDLSAEITPTDLFFVRNNYDGPEIDASQYVLKVDGEVDNPLTLRLDDMRRMEQITQTITLECAGNGRSFYSPKAPGLQWENGAGDRGLERGAVGRGLAPGASASERIPCGAGRK
jgi:DMSO/TMAO reductase YedYZ molybdopterin-dependent catalytic subunit